MCDNDKHYKCYDDLVMWEFCSLIVQFACDFTIVVSGLRCKHSLLLFGEAVKPGIKE